MDKQTCEWCRFFDAHKNCANGICRRMPRVEHVRRDDWCGEFQPREGEPEKKPSEWPHHPTFGSFLTSRGPEKKPADDGWRPIGTAPTDGFDPFEIRAHAVPKWGGCQVTVVTHWRPLPAPPKGG